MHSSGLSALDFLDEVDDIYGVDDVDDVEASVRGPDTYCARIYFDYF